MRHTAWSALLLFGLLASWITHGGPLVFDGPGNIQNETGFRPDSDHPIEHFLALPAGRFILHAHARDEWVILTSDFSEISTISSEALRVPFGVMNDGHFVGRGDANSFVWRINNIGSRDLGFTAPPIEETALDLLQAVSVQDDGKVLVAVTQGDSDLLKPMKNGLFRLNSDGSVDDTFLMESPGSWTNLSVLRDGKIICAGATIRRLLQDGRNDPTFAAPILDPPMVRCIAVRSDGAIVIGGNFATVNGVRRPGLARLASDGTLDPNFAPTFGAGQRKIGVQSDGRVIVANIIGVWRYRENGELDRTFQYPSFGTLITEIEIDAFDRIFLVDWQRILRFSGRFRITIPAAEMPADLQTAANIAGPWKSIQYVPANTATNHVHAESDTTNSFYRLQPRLN